MLQRLKVSARERLHSQRHQAGERVTAIERQGAEDRGFRDVVPRFRGTAARGVRGNPVVPFARVHVDAGLVREKNGRVGGGLRDVRNGHGPRDVLRRR